MSDNTYYVNFRQIIGLLIVDKKDAYALERAKKMGVDAFFVNPRDYASKEIYEEVIL